MGERQFPQELRFNMLSSVTFLGYDALKVTCLQAPPANFREIVLAEVMATWADHPVGYPMNIPRAGEEQRALMDVLQGRALPNSLESLVFTFRVENLPLIEVTHLLRHRGFFGIHAQCSGDRDLRNDPMYIPESVMVGPMELWDRYVKLLGDAAQLYADMVDSKEISLMDARYILPRASMYFYYFSANLRDLVAFIKQRRCTMIQTRLDNIFSDQLYQLIAQHVPEIRQVLSMQCDSSCAYVRSARDKNTRLYAPDAHHAELLNKAGLSVPESVYQKTRKEMNGG